MEIFHILPIQLQFAYFAIRRLGTEHPDLRTLVLNNENLSLNIYFIKYNFHLRTTVVTTGPAAVVVVTIGIVGNVLVVVIPIVVAG